MESAVQSKAHRSILLVCGALGALLAVIADNIMLWQPGSVADVEARGLELVTFVSAERLRFGSLLGVPAFFLQTVGVLGVYLCLNRSTRLNSFLSTLAAGLFGFALFAGVAWHISYPPLGAAFAVEGIAGPAREALANQLVLLLADFYYLSILAFGFGSVVFAAIVLLDRSDFPRWFVIISPFLLQFALQMISTILPAPLGVGLFVCSLNVALLIFFLSALWLVRESREKPPGTIVQSDHFPY